MKRMGVLFLLALLILTGCGEQPETVGICFRDCDDPATAQYRQTLEQSLTDAGYAVEVADAGDDQSIQNRQIEVFLSGGADLLIVEPVMTSAADEILEQFISGKTPAVFVNREPERTVLERWDKICYVGYDAAQPGAMQGQLLRQLPDGGDINGDGLVSCVVITGPEVHLDAQIRTQTCLQELAGSGVQTDVLAVEYGEWTREHARQTCENLLAKYGKDIEVVFCGSDELALGAVDAIRDGGRTVGENIYLMGIGGDRQALMLIRSGDLTGTISLDIPGQTENVLAAVKALLSGKETETVSYVNHIAITADNVEAYIAD